VIWVSLSTVKLVAAVPPTPPWPVKPVPMMVTLIPPAAVPDLGVMLVIVGPQRRYSHSIVSRLDRQ